MSRFYSICMVVVLTTMYSFVHAQKVKVDEPAYRRSSICMILMDEASMPKRDTIKDAFLSAVIPDKYNDHNIAVRCFEPALLKMTDEDKKAYEAAVAAGQGQADGAKKGGGLGLMKVASTGSGTPATKEDFAILANKYLAQEKVAKQMFDKWFLDQSGNFSMELIKERGKYDASVTDVQTAKSSTKGMGMLEDAGEELINNTFVVVSRFRYLSKDELVAEIDAMAQLVASQINNQYASMAAKAATLAVKASLGAGYYVRTTSYLFQLKWNEEVAATLYGELWDNPEAYNLSDIFSFKYIGNESAWANVKAGIFTNKEESELIRIATVNATDAVLAKLEKKYDVFKTKTPLLSLEPLTAYIGLKEGVEPGDKYEVLELVVDPETNRTKYERKAVLKVTKDKDQIWDNRFMADEERLAGGKGEQTCTATLFEGKATGIYPGYLLRQIK